MRTVDITLNDGATDLLDEAVRDKAPVLVTRHGLPSAYLVDAETFERLQERVNLLEGIARGEHAIVAGRTLSHGEARKRMARWLG